MAASDVDFEQAYQTLRQKYSAKFEPLLDAVDGMLREAARHEHELQCEIAQLKGLPAPPVPPMLIHWTRSSVFDAQQYLHSVDAELGRLKTGC